MSALASIPLSLVFSASVKALVSASASYAVFISAPVWSAVALASIPFNLVWSASVKSFVVKPPSPTVYVVLVLSIVKLGYVPVTVVAPVPVKATVWSGELFVIVPLLAIEIPVPAMRTPVTLAAVTLASEPSAPRTSLVEKPNPSSDVNVTTPVDAF